MPKEVCKQIRNITYQSFSDMVILGSFQYFESNFAIFDDFSKILSAFGALHLKISSNMTKILKKEEEEKSLKNFKKN